MASEADLRLAAIAAEQHGVFSRSQAHDLGFRRDHIRSRVRRSAWERMARDVFRLPGTPQTWRQRVMAAVLEAGTGSVASHRSAAVLLGVPRMGESDVEVTHPECRDHRVTLSRLHQSSLLPPEHRTIVDGIPCTTLPRTLFDLAGTEHPARVWNLVSSANRSLGLRVGHLEPVVALLATRGRRGTRTMREILDRLDAGVYRATESELEALVLAVIAAAELPAPEPQVVVGSESPVGRVDFLYRSARIVIEAQSRAFHHDWDAQQADMARRAELAAAGLLVIEVTWWQLVHEPQVFVDRLRRALGAVAA